MKKQEFAARLLFWLLPWPISKILPRSLRIYYFGPAAGPPPGFYDYWGVPGFYWPDPDVPPDPDLFPDLPDDPFNPGDPVDPTPPDQWPDLPGGPDNPSDPYTPGPGPVTPHPPIHGFGWQQFFDDTRWEQKLLAVWNVDHWDFIGTNEEVSIKAKGSWYVGYIPTQFRITHDYGANCFLALYNSDDQPIWEGFCNSGQIYPCMIPAFGSREVSWLYHSAPPGGSDFDITNIEFYD